MEVQLLPFQDRFLFSERRFPALIAAIGTGKTLMLLLKVWKYCEQYPDSLGLIVRKEFTDLRDSTLKDFERYFGVGVDSNKEYKFPHNKSVIMFRHGAEMNVLKNINVSIFGIEQAEEFETDETFDFLRDRLRRPNGPYRQGVIIANANGHNWIWKRWINNPPSEEYDGVTACSFDNPYLPQDFIDDLKRMEKEAPNHYRQYILNSFEETGADDLMFTHDMVYGSPTIRVPSVGIRRSILSVDVARYGKDECVFTVLESRGVLHWEQTHQETTKGKSLMETVGKIVDLHHRLAFDSVVVDDTGLGGGVTDRLREFNIDVLPFNGAEASTMPLIGNRRAEGYVKLSEMMVRGYIKILPSQELQEQLMTIKYKYLHAKKYIVSKDEMRKEGIKSPDCADALMMAVFFCDRMIHGKFGGRLPEYAVTDQDVNMTDPRHGSLPQYGVTEAWHS